MSEEQAVQLHPLLKLIEPNVYPKERVQALWDHLKNEEYAFDDTTRGDSLGFITQILLPSNLHFELGDMEGLVVVNSLQPRVNGILHFAVWGDLSVTKLNSAAKSLADWLFSTYSLNRLTACIPQSNDKAKRMAVLLGMKYEGTIREAFLSNGVYQNVLFFGVLRSEFDLLRRF